MYIYIYIYVCISNLALKSYQVCYNIVKQSKKLKEQFPIKVDDFFHKIKSILMKLLTILIPIFIF